MSVLIERIRARLDALGLKPATAARAAGLHPDYLRNILEAKSLSPRADKLARLARVLQCDLQYLLGDTTPPAFVAAGAAPGELREEPAAFAHFAPTEDQLPIYRSTEGGSRGFVVSMVPIEFIRRPEPLARVPDAFGVYMIGQSMRPKYGPGDLLLIHPARPPAPGDHVLALRDTEPHDAVVGCYLGRNPAGAMTLDRHAPGLPPTALPAEEQWRLHVIVGSYDGR